MCDGVRLVGIILQRARRISVGNLLRDDPCAQLIDFGVEEFSHQYIFYNIGRGSRDFITFVRGGNASERAMNFGARGWLIANHSRKLADDAAVKQTTKPINLTFTLSRH